MYLTRCFINPARRGAARLLGSPHRLHAAVLAGFPPGGEAEDEAGRVLWRLDRYPNRRTELLVVSPERPDLTHLVEQAGWPISGESWETAEYGRFLSALGEGQTWAFRLMANPVRHGRKPGDKETRPYGLVREEDQINWLAARQERMGVSLGEDVPAVRVVRQDSWSFKRKRDVGAQVTLNTVVFEGTLAVIDADLLKSTLTQGIGRARAYGCGLLTLARG